jgi:hypothetical protein
METPVRRHFAASLPASLPASLLAPFALGLLAAQQPATPATAGVPQDLAELAARVDAAHHPKGHRPEVTSFRGSLSIQSNIEDQRGEAELDVQFLLWRREGSDRVRSLIRYRIADSAQRIERGYDRSGPWAIIDGAARDLEAKELATDREALDRHRAFARQLLRFLDPGAVLRSLQHAEPVAKAPLRFGREPEQIECLVARGELAGFPLGSRGGEETPVRAAVHVDAASGGGAGAAKPADGAKGEFLRLLEPQLRNDILVPRKLMQYETDAAGAPRLRMTVRITALELGAKLDVDAFDRPKK